MLNIEKGRQYQWQGNIYVVTEVVGATPQNPVAEVKYERVADKKSRGVMSAAEFVERMLPLHLRLGDEIAGKSMGKLYSRYTVTAQVGNRLWSCTPVNIARPALIVKTDVDGWGKIEVVDGGEQATDYYFWGGEVRLMFSNQRELASLGRWLCVASSWITSHTPQTLNPVTVREQAAYLRIAIENVCLNLGIPCPQLPQK